MVGVRFVSFKNPVNNLTCFFFYTFRILGYKSGHSPLQCLAQGFLYKSPGFSENQFSAHKPGAQSNQYVYQVIIVISG